MDRRQMDNAVFVPGGTSVWGMLREQRNPSALRSAEATTPSGISLGDRKSVEVVDMWSFEAIG